MPVNENRLREIMLAEVDAELDKPYDPANDFDVTLDLKADLKEKGRGYTYPKTKEAVAQLVRLMMDMARG